MVNELVEVIRSVIWRQDRAVPAGDRGICARCFHHGHCGGTHDISVRATIAEAGRDHRQAGEEQNKAVQASGERHS